VLLDAAQDLVRQRLAAVLARHLAAVPAGHLLGSALVFISRARMFAIRRSWAEPVRSHRQPHQGAIPRHARLLSAARCPSMLTLADSGVCGLARVVRRRRGGRHA